MRSACRPSSAPARLRFAWQLVPEWPLPVPGNERSDSERFERQHNKLFKNSRAFHFNVSQGLEEIGLEKADQLGGIKAATRRYLAQQDVLVRMESCAKTLKQRGRTSTIL